MNLYVIYLAGVFSLAGLAAIGAAYLAYGWGRFAALKARSLESPKWKAYVLSLLPPAAFATSFLFDGQLSSVAGETFSALATPALIGTCFRYNRSRYFAE